MAKNDGGTQHGGSVIVAWFLPADLAQSLAVPDGESAVDLHLTLCFLGDHLDGDQVTALKTCVQAVCEDTEPITGIISGIGRFTPSDGNPPPIYASVDAPGLSQLYTRLMEALTLIGLEPSADHGFTPHITLIYSDGDMPPEPAPDFIDITEITVAAGTERLAFPLGGTAGFKGDAMDPNRDPATFGWLPEGTTQGDLDDGDFAWLSDAYKAGKASKTEGRKLPFKVHGKVNVDGWKAAWGRAHQSDTDFSGGPSQAEVIAKLKAAKPAGVTVEMAQDDVETGKKALSAAFDTLMEKVGLGKPKTGNVTLAATFAVEDETQEGDDVLLTGRLFKSGEYPDVAFAMTPAELYDTIAGFLEPVPMDLEHRPSFLRGVDLTGTFGEVEAVWADDSGEWMMARARKPKWLHTVMPETRVSATFSRGDKALIGAAWTATPRVSGAQLVAAFAGTRHDTPSGQFAMQRIHDATVSGGAVCKRVAMASSHESRAIQQVHDLTVSHGASCESGSMPAMYSTDKPKGATMSTLRDWITGKAKAEGVELDPADLDAAFSANPPTLAPEVQAKLDAQEAENKKLREEQERHTAAFARLESEKRHAEAVTFAQSQVQAQRITPAAAEALVPLHERIAAADATATFAEGVDPTAKLLADFIAKLPDFSLFTTENIKRDDLVALFNVSTKADDGKPTDARKKELMGKSSLGQDVLKHQSNGA